MAIAQSTPAKAKKMTVASVLKQIETEKIRWIDLQFVDVLGALQHITIPATSLGTEEFKLGVGKLDGSSIKGFKEIHESDMVMNPDPSTFAVLPWYEGEHRTARFLVDGIRLLPSADAARNPWSGAGYEIISREAPWSDSGGKEFPIRFKEGYYPAPPVDSLQDYRNEACRILVDSFGMTLDAHHHEVATAGQCEIDMRYDELVPMADNVVTYRYVMKMVAHKMGMMATFMPKPIEYRTPDTAWNPYLSFAAMLCAGLDGVKRKLDPGDPVDEDLYHLSASKRKEYGVRELPGSLKESIEHLQTDYMFLKSVFPQDLLEKYEELKLDEHLQTSLRPSPYEFYRYMDA